MHRSAVESNATVIDFMAVVRRITSVQLKNISTFGSFCKFLLNILLSYAAQSEELHVVLETDKELSPKGAERLRRSGGQVSKVCEVVADDQQLPDWTEFFSSTQNKASFQDFFVNFCIRTYTIYIS